MVKKTKNIKKIENLDFKEPNSLIENLIPKTEIRLQNIDVKEGFWSKIKIWNRNPSFILVFFANVNKRIIEIARRKISIKNDIFRFQGKSYSPSLNNPTYQKGNSYFYYMNIQTNAQALFYEVESLINPEEMDQILSRKMFPLLSTSLKTNTFSMNATFGFICVILGLFLGYIIGNFIPF